MMKTDKHMVAHTTTELTPKIAGGKKRMLLTFGWSVIIMVILVLLDNDAGPEHFPYVDGGTIVFFLLVAALAQLLIVLTDRISKPELLHIMWPFLSNIMAIAVILGLLFAAKAV